MVFKNMIMNYFYMNGSSLDVMNVKNVEIEFLLLEGAMLF